LEKQIHEKADKAKNIPHHSSSMQKLIYNPIVNPIDYKIDINNKYVLQ
jgi:hypothetical protein